jgi:phosphoglycolate phosphatase
VNSTDPGRPERADTAALDRAVDRMRYVLFDFDGPLCWLYANHPAAKVAAKLRAFAAAQGRDLSEAGASDDPHEVLHAIAALQGHASGGADLLAEADGLLTAEEVSAARTAEPTLHAAELVHALAWHRVPVAVVTNNSALAVHEYLERRGLAAHFGSHIHGREPGRPDLMKPHPHCLRQALAALDAPGPVCVMLGDEPRDLNAARSANVSFVGYARNRRKALRLRAAGAEVVVASLDELCAALERTKRR